MKFKQTMVSGAVASALLAMCGTAMASGFALIEQNASGLGNAYAGGAAVAEDASTIFFNPAGMSRLSGKQVVVAAHAITPSAKFTSSAGVSSGGDAGSTAIVPNAYFAMEVKPGLKAGIGVNAPFGLQTEYDANWAGKSQAIKSKLETINLNPSLSYQVNDALSVGAGIDYQRISGELSNDAGPAGTAVVKGSDYGWGYNLGALYNINATTRVGVAYRSAISYTLTGTLTTAMPAANGPVSLDVKLPDSLSLSAHHQMSDNYAVMADVTFTGWSSFKQVKVMNTATNMAVSNTIENWKDTVRVSIGATHRYNSVWSARAGLAYDQAPVPDAFRTPRIPDNNRTWLALGGQYRAADNVTKIDFGYAHLFVSDSTINSGSLVGSYKNKVDILSVQYTRNF